jgi:hypothetical protein
MWSWSSSTPSALGVAPSWNPICHGYAESHSSGDRNDGVISCSIIVCVIYSPLYTEAYSLSVLGYGGLYKIDIRSTDKASIMYELPGLLVVIKPRINSFDST